MSSPPPPSPSGGPSGSTTRSSSGGPSGSAAPGPDVVELDLTNDEREAEGVQGEEAAAPRKRKKERPKKSPIWKHFTVFVADPSKAICKHCEEKESLIAVFKIVWYQRSPYTVQPGKYVLR